MPLTARAHAANNMAEDTSCAYSFFAATPRQLSEAAGRLAAHMRVGDVVLLAGNLGAGKTHFVKGAAAALGYEDDVTSPTFTIMHVYETPSLPLFHFDLYRLEDAAELEEVGFFEAVDAHSAGAAFVEWSDRFPEEMPEDALCVHIAHDGEGRRIEARACGVRAAELLAAWRVS